MSILTGEAEMREIINSVQLSDAEFEEYRDDVEANTFLHEHILNKLTETEILTFAAILYRQNDLVREELLAMAQEYSGPAFNTPTINKLTDECFTV